MAILEDKKLYYKIYYPECFVKNNTVYVCVDTYETIKEREREKQHIDSFNIELEKLRLKANKMLDDFIKKLPQNLIDDNTENSDFDKNGIIKNSEFRVEHIEINKLQTAISFAYDRIYSTVDTNDIDFNVLEKYGLDMTLLNNPIKVSRNMTIATGDYNLEELTTEFFYNKLKTIMNTDLIEDC